MGCGNQPPGGASYRRILRILLQKKKGKAVGIGRLEELFDLVGKSGRTGGVTPFAARGFGLSPEHSPGCARSARTGVKEWGIAGICVA